MKLFIIILFSSISFQANAQKTLDELLAQYNNNSIPYITVQELAMPKTNAIILDAREPEEYQVSHIQNAISVGYNQFDLAQMTKQFNDKQQTIVVYCSLGIRSETISEQLKNAGYNNVYNLYGGIFEWKNADFPVFDSEGKETENVHAFSKSWGKWLLKGHKIFD